MQKRIAPTLKQELFVLAYLGAAKDNASKAAAIAGYAGDSDTLKTMGSKLVAKGYIQARIDGRLGAAGATVEAVLQELTEVAFAAVNYGPEGNILDAPAVKAKLKALELLGKYHAMFTDVIKGDIPTTLDGLRGYVAKELERVGY